MKPQAESSEGRDREGRRLQEDAGGGGACDARVMGDTLDGIGTGGPVRAPGGTIVGMGALPAACVETGPRVDADLAIDRTLPSRVFDGPIPEPGPFTGVEIPEARAGERVGRKYVLERRLARGTMGDVWRAMDEALSRPVAIKLVHAHLSTSPRVRERFRAEARAAAPLSSRHVVRIYDHGETDHGIPFLVMEYLEGETLEDLLEREECLGLTQTLRIVLQIARGLDAAHAKGIVHRDLKPENVFLARTFDDAAPVAKVLDFGVAKVVADGASKTSSLAGAPIGTPLFMSPELARGHCADHRTDLYSLGAIAYNALTGSYAFQGASAADLLASICTEPLPLVRDRAPWLPQGIERWFARACAREPSRRFSTGRELADALASALRENSPHRPGDSTAPTAQDVPTTSATPPRSAPRVPWLAAAGAALAIGAISTAGLLAAKRDSTLRSGLQAPSDLDAFVTTVEARARHSRASAPR